MSERIPRLYRAMGGGIGFGADYNPEQWPREVWREDVRLMREAGVTIVTLGIFSWAAIEKEPGERDFGWLDEVMDLLGEAGIAVSLATGTASPPPWLARLHPETLPVDAEGRTLWTGARQQYCPSSPAYRAAALDFATAMAKRYGQHPALALWHVGNEYGCHVDACYCDASAAGFREWLRARYGDLDGLNAAWSTDFWSQRYSDWSEVLPPRLAPTFPNPAQQLDFRRFSSDAMRECYLMEREALLALLPDIPVTTNMMGLWKSVDSFSWADELDIAALDLYPEPKDPTAHIGGALFHDLTRSLRRGQPWMLMEQAPSAISYRPPNRPKKPGQMRLWSMQAVARGADAVMYFQWRASAGGAEKFHSAVVGHGGTDNRVFREVSALGKELAGLADVAGSRVRAQVALVHDWANWWALELDARPAELELLERLKDHYAALWHENVTVDIVPPGADLSGYKLVAVPNLYLVSAEAAADLAAYVRGGGRLLMSFFSGIADERDRIHLGGYPGPFRELLGLRVDEFWPLGEGETVTLTDGTTAGLWADDLVLEGAEPLARYAGGPLAGVPAVTRHAYGAGSATYLGTRLEPGAMRALVRAELAAAGVEPVLPDLPEGVEAVAREAADGTRFLFLLNHTDAPVRAYGTDLPGQGVAVLREERS
ncbi:beta-galactosidase [Thermocatellispora tengchongensis]|uniref:Beta-galactosidase n=1 Tax=Thermocatellispora tengchongensis TaxID=1073253 RepID=A0A840P624_9ACTN|nr:beta-galactosidase [Thermocatellispora tengchongensis]MBB5134016.1 beta-galactosidase [Thermocatellispora tengchongensis]